MRSRLAYAFCASIIEDTIREQMAVRDALAAIARGSPESILVTMDEINEVGIGYAIAAAWAGEDWPVGRERTMATRPMEGLGHGR